MRRMATEAPDHLLTYMNRQVQNYKGQPSEKMEILNKILPLIERVRDQRLSSLYLQEAADRLGVEPQWILKEKKQMSRQVLKIINKNENKQLVKGVPPEESFLVQFMLRKSEYLRIIQDSGAIDKFLDSDARNIARKTVEKYWQNPNDFDKLGASLVGEGIFHELLTSHIGLDAAIGDLDEAGELQLIQDCLIRVKDRHLRAQSRELLSSLKTETDLNSEKLEIFMKIAMEQKGPKNP